MASLNYCLPLTLFLVGELLLTAGLPKPGQAQSAPTTPENIISSRSVVQVTFEPRGNGTPDDTAGGASRDGGICPQDSAALGSPITPLMPATLHGLTLADHPTFFVYVPQTSAQKALFVLKDASENYYYQKQIAIPRSPGGILSFKLPADAPALMSGKSYKWSFVLMCEEGLRPDSPRVEGRVERIELTPALSAQLKTLSPLERAALYGKDGVWYDTLTSLAELRRSQPNDVALATTWKELLKSVGLGGIADRPLIQ
ncbi:MAG TPA: DUF928 domain-containing protein [Allocoleopsis sp.]